MPAEAVYTGVTRHDRMLERIFAVLKKVAMGI